jgi:hypothetical protein
LPGKLIFDTIGSNILCGSGAGVGSMSKKQVRFPHKLLVGSVFFFLLGIGMLLVTTGLLPRYEDLWPIPLCLLGLFLLYLVAVKDASIGYVVPGVLFSLSGFLLILHAVFFPFVSMDRFWPLFMTIAGFSLFVYGRRVESSLRVAVVVPAVSIIILSLIFFPFSLDLIRQDFTSFVAVWWPVLFLLLSAGLLGAYLRKKRE